MKIGTRVKVTNEAGTEYGVVVGTPRLMSMYCYTVRSESDGMVYNLSSSVLEEMES